MTDHPIFEYFDYDEAANISKCLIIDCQHPNMTGKHAHNLRKHLQRRHQHLMPQLEERLLRYSKNKKVTKKKITATKITINLSREDFLMGCTEMVTLNGRPFSIVDDSGLRRIFDPIRNAFERINTPAQINSEKLQYYANELQHIVKNKIKAEMKGNLIALQLDLTHHFHRCILGVNAQFSIENEMVVRTLAMRRLLGQTTSLNIALEVQNILEEYDVDVDDIYALTTDNGSNVLGVSSILQIMQEGKIEEFMSNRTNTDELDLELLNELIEIEANRILQGQTLHFMHKIHCASHVFQLIIGDTLACEETAEFIAAARDLVIKLRAPNVMNLLNSRQLKTPLLDSDIRWSSVSAMVSILHQRTSDIKYEFLISKRSSFSIA